MKQISLFLFKVWLTFWTLIEMSSFVVGRECFLTNCQSMQEMSAPLSIRMQVSMTFNMWEGVIIMIQYVYLIVCLFLLIFLLTYPFLSYVHPYWTYGGD